VADSKLRYPDELRLKPGVSLSQTRFALANFCLSHFGADGQYYADVMELCTDANLLQQALNTITAEVSKRCPDRMPALAACVREANDTDLESSASGLRPAAAPGAAQVQPPAQRAAAAQAAPRPTAPRPAAAADPRRLAPGVSLAQARFALAEFCLDQYGAASQPLVDAINSAADLPGLQAILGRVAADVQAHHREALGKLADCVREINETAE